MSTTENLNVALLQADLVWENPKENKQRFEKKINQLSKNIHLIVLPEMFTSGFTMNAEDVAETMSGATVQWMQKIALSKNMAITGSIVITENKQFFNRLLFVHPSGKIDFYDKKHTFTLAGEGEVYSKGNQKIIIDYKGWKICPFICYDLRFPVWTRNTKNYDILLFVASWPKPRIDAWNTLLKARAIENMSYTIGVNRVGKDANNYEYTGNSACFDALGNSLIENTNSNENSFIIELNKQKQDIIRTKFNFLEDKDTFKIIP